MSFFVRFLWLVFCRSEWSRLSLVDLLCLCEFVCFVV